MASVAAKKSVYFLSKIDGWRLFEEGDVFVDSYENLKKRIGNLDLPHLKIEFKNYVKTQIETIFYMGETTTVKSVISWEKPE